MNNFHIRDDFKAGAPISQVPASWFNAVASFLNNLVGGYGIRVVKNQRGASTVEIDESYLHKDKAITVSHETFATPDATLDSNNQIPQRHTNGSSVVLQTNSWTRGDRDTNDKLKGVKVYLPTDCFDTGVRNCLCWRLCEFDCEGKLKSVGNETVMTFACSAEQL